MQKKKKSIWRKLKSKLNPIRTVNIELSEKQLKARNHLWASNIAMILAFIVILGVALTIYSPRRMAVRRTYKTVTESLGEGRFSMYWGTAKTEEDLKKIEDGTYIDKDYLAAINRHISEIRIDKDGKNVVFACSEWVTETQKSRLRKAILDYFQNQSEYIKVD